MNKKHTILHQTMAVVTAVLAASQAHAQVPSEPQPAARAAQGYGALGKTSQATPLLELRSLVQQSLDYSPHVREAAANWRAAQSDVEQAEGGLWPRLEIGANSSAITSQGHSSNSLNGGMSATLSYNVYDFGRVRNQIQARQMQSASLKDKFRLAREDVAYETANAHLQLLKYQRMSDIYGQYVADMQLLTDKLVEIVDVFPGRRSELTQAQARLGQAKDGLNSLRSRMNEARLILQKLTGRPVTDVIRSELPTLVAPEIHALSYEAKKHHPAVQAAWEEAAAARAQAQEAQASLKPQADLQMVKQTGQDANGLTVPTRIYLTARWVAFDGYSTKANAQAYEERARAAEERSEQLVQEILFNIRNAASEHEVQSSRNKDLAQLVKSTDQVRKDYYDQWRELGRRSLLDVLSAEGEHLNTRLNLAGTELDQRIAVLRMRHEAGNFAEWLATATDAPATAQAPASTPTQVSTPPLRSVGSPIPNPPAYQAVASPSAPVATPTPAFVAAPASKSAPTHVVVASATAAPAPVVAVRAPAAEPVVAAKAPTPVTAPVSATTPAVASVVRPAVAAPATPSVAPIASASTPSPARVAVAPEAQRLAESQSDAAIVQQSPVTTVPRSAVSSYAREDIRPVVVPPAPQIKPATIVATSLVAQPAVAPVPTPKVAPTAAPVTAPPAAPLTAPMPWWGAGVTNLGAVMSVPPAKF